MKKIRYLIGIPQFWIWTIVISAIVLIVETFFFGLWAIPGLNYSIAYMNEITALDTIFVVLFAIIFGISSSLYIIVRKAKGVSCAVGSTAGLTGIFTLLCPVCPIFFLAYFGLSATVMTLSPYFWLFRILSLVLIVVGIVILWKYLKIGSIKQIDLYLLIQKIAVIVIAFLIFNNQAMAIGLGHKMIDSPSGGEFVLTGDFAQDIGGLVIMSQMPFYGAELGLDLSNLNAINKSIKKLATMAPKQGSNPIELTEAEMERYVAIGTEPTITCEFCCSVMTLVREDGTPTCGCAHSIAMRGTAAYLLRNYPEMTNAEISYELVRQKGLYFPKQLQKRLASQLTGNTDDYTPDVKYLLMNLSESEIAELSSKAKASGFEPEEGPSMVGGC